MFNWELPLWSNKVENLEFAAFLLRLCTFLKVLWIWRKIQKEFQWWIFIFLEGLKLGWKKFFFLRYWSSETVHCLTGLRLSLKMNRFFSYTRLISWAVLTEFVERKSSYFKISSQIIPTCSCKLNLILNKICKTTHFSHLVGRNFSKSFGRHINSWNVEKLIFFVSKVRVGVGLSSENVTVQPIS